MAATEPTTKPARCPVFEGFDPLDPEQVVDPYPWVARARREMPVFYMPTLDEWCVTRWADVEDVLRDPETYSSADLVTLPTLPAEARELLPDGYSLADSLASTDPPRHTRMRKLAQKAFTPRQANAQVPAVRALVDSLIDGFIGDGRVDLVTEYFHRIPIRVIAPILGVPVEDGEQLYDWIVDALTLVGDPHLTDEKVLALCQTQALFDRYVRDLVADRRAHPRGPDDLITQLIEATSDDDEPALLDHEIVGIVAGAIAAGGDTSAGNMAQCVHILLKDRTLWTEVVANQDLVENAIEETLRFNPPGRGSRRTTTRDCVLGGVTLPKGARLFVHIASANRDEAQYPDNDRFDLHRPNIKGHLGFGRWTHFCIGAPIARMEMRIGVGRLIERIPDMRLVPGHELEYVTSIQVVPIVRGLVVEWDTTA